ISHAGRRLIGTSPYFIGVIKIHDHERYAAEVVGRGPQSIAAHHGRIHLIGDVTNVTEDSPTANRIIVVEFPNSAALQAWRDVGGDPARFVARQQLGRYTPSRFILAIDEGERLSVVADASRRRATFVKNKHMSNQPQIYQIAGTLMMVRSPRVWSCSRLALTS